MVVVGRSSSVVTLLPAAPGLRLWCLRRWCLRRWCLRRFCPALRAGRSGRAWSRWQVGQELGSPAPGATRGQGARVVCFDHGAPCGRAAPGTATSKPSSLPSNGCAPSIRAPAHPAGRRPRFWKTGVPRPIEGLGSFVPAERSGRSARRPAFQRRCSLFVHHDRERRHVTSGSRQTRRTTEAMAAGIDAASMARRCQTPPKEMSRLPREC